jgi:hypothetical protein
LSVEALEARDLPDGGPFLVALTPNGLTAPPINDPPINVPLSSISVTFNEPIDPQTFTLATNESARTGVALGILTSIEGRLNRAAELFTTYLHHAPADVSAYANQLGGPTATRRWWRRWSPRRNTMTTSAAVTRTG